MRGFLQFASHDFPVFITHLLRCVAVALAIAVVLFAVTDVSVTWRDVGLIAVHTAGMLLLSCIIYLIVEFVMYIR